MDFLKEIMYGTLPKPTDKEIEERLVAMLKRVREKIERDEKSKQGDSAK